MPDLNVYNHQKVIPLSADLSRRLHCSGCKAVSEVLRLAKTGRIKRAVNQLLVLRKKTRRRLWLRR